jgi:hypothetical protein
MNWVRTASGLALGAVFSIALFVGGCVETPIDTSTAPPTPPPTKAETSAASLRQGLDALFGEHVVLVASATNAALGGRLDEYNAASNALDDNSRELEGAVRTIYGEDAGRKFYDLWHTHIGYLVDYTQGVATNDEAKRTKAVNDLIAYSTDFGNMVQSLTGGRLTRDTVADLMRGDIAELKGVIDAQGAKDYALAYTDERDAEKQSFILGNTWSNAIVLHFPEKY